MLGWLASKGTAGFEQAITKIFADCGVIRDDATQVGNVIHCVEVGTVDAGMIRIVLFSWRGLVQHPRRLSADGETEVL